MQKYQPNSILGPALQNNIFLAYIWPMFLFYIGWEHQKIFGHWPELG